MAVLRKDPGRIVEETVADGVVYCWEGGPYAAVSEKWLAECAPLLPWTFDVCGVLTNSWLADGVTVVVCRGEVREL